MDKLQVESQLKYETLVEAMGQGFFALLADGTFVDVNPAALEILGLDRDQFLARKNISTAWKIINEDGTDILPEQFPSMVALRTGLPVRDTVVGVYNPQKESFLWLIVTAIPIFREEDTTASQVFITFQDITERKAMEENYRRLAGLTSDYVHCCSRTGKSEFQIQWVDGAINSVSGYNVKELLTLGCFLPLVHSNDRQRVSDYLLSLVPGDNKSIEFRIVTQQQEIRWVSERSQCKAGHFEGELILLGAVTDITERIHSEQALVKSREMLEETENLGKVGGWEFNIDTGKQIWTKGVYDIHEVDYGYDPTLSNGIDFYTQDSRPIIAAAVKQAVAQGEPFDVELEIKTAKGNLRRVHAIGKADLENRRVHGFFQDITERKTNQLALLAATQATEAANRAKGLFMAKMSHELRTPMTAIIGFGELLEDADLTPEHKRYLAAINTSGNALSSLIDDFLDLSKVDAGELAVKPKEFSLHNLITKFVATQEQQIARKNLLFNLSIESDVPDLLIGDPQRIQQVLLNLLGNAIKFTEKGDIGIAVSVAEENNLRVLLDFAVRDTGIGISANRLGYIFEPFAQVLGSSSDNHGGSGLGLTISRSLAGLMGGTIRVESQVGIGSTFHLLLPLQKKNDNLSEKPLPEKEASLWCGPVLNILLAEDNPINSHFIKTALKDMGHTVTVAENGKVALDTLKVNTFDLVLMDIQMPVMNGSDVLSVIRELEQSSGKHLTVIALTAYALFGDKEKYLDMGFDGYLSKPFKTKELMDEMVRVVPG